jgi:hypothetical protein
VVGSLCQFVSVLKLFFNVELTWSVNNAVCVNWQELNMYSNCSCTVIHGTRLWNCADYRHQSSAFARIKLAVVIMLTHIVGA